MQHREEPLLQAQGLCKRYGGADVLTSVDMCIMPAQSLTIIGPNGAGKTTLLRCLLGLEAPDNGTIHRASNLRIGYMPQVIAAHPSMPIRVKDFLALYATSRPAIMPLLDRLGVTALARQMMHTLSGGELRRIYLARALLNNPNLLVLDEPTQAIDVNGQAEFYRTTTELTKERGCAVLMVSHDLHVVMASTDRVLCLNGHICCEGAPQTVGEHPEFRALFGDAMASQLALYTHHHTHTHDLSGDIVSHERCNHE
jgi:zinc transport system ATP-binding protein